MSIKYLKARTQQATNTEADWISYNPVLRDGEVVWTSDTTPPKSKIGDGLTAWVDLNYINEGGGGGGGITPSFETVSKNLTAWNFTINYNLDDMVNTIVYTSGASTITKTFGYTGDKLTTITLSGSTPGGIDLIKTLTYTGDALTSVAYT